MEKLELFENLKSRKYLPKRGIGKLLSKSRDDELG